MLKVILETGGNYVKESQLTRQTYQLKWTASRSLALKIKELIFLVSYGIYIAFIQHHIASIVIGIFLFIGSPVNSKY